MRIKGMDFKKQFFALLLLALSSPVAAELPMEASVPGGVALVPLQSSEAPRPSAYYNDKRVWVTESDGQWYAVVGISLGTKPGQQTLRIGEGKEGGDRRFNVGSKTYEEQHITLKNKRMVNPNKADLKRIRRDQQRSGQLFAAWNEAGEVSSRFTAPVEGRLSSPFGLQRFFNGEARKPHSGIDIAAPQGTPVRAPAPGIVVEVNDYYFNGKTVFIDHGHGLISMLCHLDTIDVEMGQRVEPGETIATVGMTGRATGPHLHWTVSLNNARVDPLLFMSDATVAAFNTASND